MRPIARAGLLLIALGSLTSAAPPFGPDPLIGALHRMDRYFQRHEADAVVMDRRWVINASEAARLSVVPQLLGYAELHRVLPAQRIRRYIARRADYLIAHYDQFHSGGVFDGMLGYAFFEAYEATGDPRYRDQGLTVVQELKGMSSEFILNGGLMAAMAFTKHFQLTGDPESEQWTHTIIASLPGYQHDDGSFPHWCPCSADIHYTDWMATELILIRRQMSDPLIDLMLTRMFTFMEQRVQPDGNSRYEEPCDDFEGCVNYYYSIASGCGIDYDTRAFTNELGYSALLFDHFDSPRYDSVMRFLLALENRGTYPDKWDFWPPPSDPYYPWTAADTSVVNTSLLFWSLASVASGRYQHLPPHPEWFPGGGEADLRAERVRPEMPVTALPAKLRSPRGSAVVVSRVDALMLAGADPNDHCDGRSSFRRWRFRDTPPRDPGRLPDTPRMPVHPGAREVAVLELESVAPNPSPESCTLRFRLSKPASVTITIHDARGRTVRVLTRSMREPGAHEVHWDRRDRRGAPCESGVYFARIRAGADTKGQRIVLVR